MSKPRSEEIEHHAHALIERSREICLERGLSISEVMHGFVDATAGYCVATQCDPQQVIDQLAEAIRRAWIANATMGARA